MAEPWLASLLRWTGQERRTPSLDELLAAMDAAGVELGAPERVARAAGRADLQRRGRRLRGRGAGPPARGGVGRPGGPDGRRARDPALRRRARLRRRPRPAVALGAAAGRPALLPGVRGLRGARRALRHAGRAHGAAAAVRARAPDPVPGQRRCSTSPSSCSSPGTSGSRGSRRSSRWPTSTPGLHVDTSAYALTPPPAGVRARGCAGGAGRGSCSARTGPCWPRRGAWRASTAWASTTRRGSSSSAATPGGSSRSERGAAGRSRDRSGQQDHQDDDEDERADADVHLEDLLSSGTAPSYPGGRVRSPSVRRDDAALGRDRAGPRRPSAPSRPPSSWRGSPPGGRPARP